NGLNGSDRTSSAAPNTALDGGLDAFYRGFSCRLRSARPPRLASGDRRRTAARFSELVNTGNDPQLSVGPVQAGHPRQCVGLMSSLSYLGLRADCDFENA